MMPSKYRFVEHSTEWVSTFQREVEQLTLLLGDEIVAVHHIGSTSINGLAAKPVIDMLPVVRNITALDDLSGLLEKAGYKCWGEYGLVGRRFITKDNNGYRTHNIHCYQEGHPDIERHVAFSAYLKHHDSARNEYETLKRKVYMSHPADIDAYNDGKNAWIKRTEPLAIEWYRQQ